MSRGGGGGFGEGRGNSEGRGSEERLGDGRGPWEVSDRSGIILLSDNFLVIRASQPQG